MKKIFVLTAAVLVSLVGFAQSKGSVEPWYVMGQASVTNSYGENIEHISLKSGLTKAGFRVGAGKEFSELWGVRATVGFDNNGGYSDNKYFSFKSFDLFADATLDLADLIAPNRQVNKNVNSQILLGIGLADSYDFSYDKNLHADNNRYDNKGHLNFGLHVGANISYNVTDQFAVGAEAGIYFMSDKFNGIKYDLCYDVRSEFGINLIYRLGK